MRLWSIHPKYLDRQGLLALWREGLLAKKVLSLKTRGYRNHPQLDRFKKTSSPLGAINAYLAFVYKEAEKRGYNFNKNKIGILNNISRLKIPVTKGQISFEYKHLLGKLRLRDGETYRKILNIKRINAHPIFTVRVGAVERWERI